MAQGLERIPLAVDSDFKAQPVRANFPDAPAQDFKLVAFEPDQMQAQPAPASLGVGDTLSSLGRNVWDAVVYHTPAAVAAAVEGDDPYATWDWKDALIGRARQRAQEVSKPGDANTKTAIPGITAQDINSLGPSAGFSAAGAAAGLGAGIPAGMVASPVAGYAAGMAASGTTAYRMATNQFVRDLHDTVNAESLKTTGKPVSPQEFQAKQAQLADTIKAYGLWEAVPEAAGNALSFGILTAPVKGAIGKLFGKNIATRFAGKLGALYGEELATETVTQMGQHNAEVGAGMTKAPRREFTSPTDWRDSFKEVAGPTMLQTTLMAGGFKAGQMAKDRLMGKADQPDNAIPAGDIGAGPGGGGIDGEFIPAGPAPALANQPGGTTYDQSRPELPAGQTMLPRLALPAPEDGGPSDRQVSTALGLLKHSPRASPELLQRLMRVDQTMATMLFNHWQGQTNGQVAGNEVAEISAQGDQGQGADIAGSRVVDGFSDGAVSFTPGAVAEVAAPGGEPGMALGAAGPDAITALDVQAHAAATSPFNAMPQPTEAQKQAGNYAKGHVKFQGMDIAIENPAGSVRSGKDADGKAWENTLAHHYGYIKGTVGKDKDHLDVFIKPGAQSARTAYVIDQINPKTGAFDEHKIVFGADSEADAQAIYHANYEQGWQGMGAITAMPMEQFKEWIKSGKTKKPVAYTEPKGVSHEKPVPKAKTPAAIDPSAPYGKVGVAPFSSQVVWLKDNGDGTATVMRGEEPFYDFENGDPVTVPAGSTAERIRQSVTDAGALSSRDKWFGVAKAETKPAETGTTPAGSGTEQAKPEAIAGKPVSDMPAEQLQKIASGESKTFGPAAVEKASAELARRDEVDSPKESKEPWQYGELEFGDKYIDETVLPDLRKQLANAHGGKFQEYPSKAAAVRGLKERIDTLENHRDAKARKYYASLDNHYGAVRAALADGKPVPPVAYESYEDLKGDVSAGRIKGDGQEVARVEQPQHIEAGQVEPATAPVIAASIKESAKNTPMDIEQARGWLLSEIDKAIIDAKSAKEEGIWNRADDKVNLEGIMDVGATIGFKTFNVPGDGKFRVLNLKESLQKFKKQVAASPGFKKNATRPMSLASGNGGKTSVRDLLDDGEYVLAADYGHLTGKPLLFGSVREGEAHPIAYTDAEPIDIKGINAQVGREWNATGKSLSWRVIETTTGLSVASESTKEKAISKALAHVDEHGTDKLKAIIAESQKVSQAELERQFTDWGSEEEAKAQKTRDAVERADAEDRALWNSIWPLDDGKKRSPNPWNDINHMQVVILAKDAAKAGKGDEFVSLIERRLGGTNNVLALAARKALAESNKPSKQSGGVDYKGFERTPTGNGNFTLKDGNLLVKVEAMGGGKFQASHGSAKSSPHINSEQGAVEWAANIRETGKPKTTGYPFYSNNKLYNAEGTAELPKNWTGVAMSDSGKRFFYLGWENGERAYNPLQAKSYGEAVKEAAEKFPVTDITPPEGYRKVSESYFGGSIPKPVYAPFADGDRVRAKEGGYLGTVDGISGAGQISDGAFIKFDNGTSKLMKWAQVEAAPATSVPSEAAKKKKVGAGDTVPTASIAGKPVSEMTEDQLRTIARGLSPTFGEAAVDKAKTELRRRDQAAKPARPYATPDDRNEAIYTLQRAAKDAGLEYSDKAIKDAAEFGASQAEIAAAIEAGEDAVSELASRYAERSNGLRQGFGQGNNDAALRAKPMSERDQRIASLTGRGLYELPEDQRSSLLKAAKVRSVDAFEDIAISDRREIIGRWIDAQPKENKVGAGETAMVAGYPVSGMGDKALAAHAQSSNAADRAAAMAEIERRKATVKDSLTPEKAEQQAEGKIDTHESLFDRLRDGTATLDEFKAGFVAVVAGKEAITAELSKLTKDAIFKRFPGLAYRYKTANKAEIVDAAYRDMASDFALGRSISYVLGFGGDGGYFKAITAMVERTTEDDLAKFAADVKAAKAERAERQKEAEAGMENPVTLDDYKRILGAKAQEIGEGATFTQARMAMTPEQRARFDELSAEKTRDERKARADQQKTEVRVAAATTEGQIVETKHTRTGEPLFVVKAAERVERDVYNQWNATAKRMGGWYSSFRGNGAVPGFQFKTRENADAFLQYLGGNVEQAKEAVQARRDAFDDDRSQSAVERLNEMADRLDEQAGEILSAERKTNTARRARFAANAEAGANAQQAMAATMRNIAAAIESGKAKFLDRVRQKVQIERMQAWLASAQYDEQRAKYPTYAEQEKHRGEKPTGETADYAKFPEFTAFRSDLARMGRRLLEIDGAKQLGTRLLKVADDVTTAYKKFAKENLHKVSTFRGANGEAAVFRTEDAAEAAIARSGFKGKATTISFKRGEHLVIMGPEMAKEAGLWHGDPDKRITLSPDFAEEIIAKAKGRDIGMPWTFEAVAADRARLKAMGIETPAEFRAALREFVAMREAPKAPDRVKELERNMIGRANDGLDFFPTPAETAQAMIDSAEIKEGMAVLEPSAGTGHIAERIRAAGVDPDVVEMASDRRELLEAKGFRLVGSDFMDMSPRGFTYGDVFRAPDGTLGVMRGSGGMGSNRVGLDPLDANGQPEPRRMGWYDRDELEGVEKRAGNSGYDRIIMNPPFSDRRDAQHVQHAYTLLKPGGRLVAIMGEGVFFGQDKKAQAFRDWLEEVGGTSEKLEEGTFLDPSLPVNTGVNARMVVVEKGEGGVIAEPSSAAPGQFTSPKLGTKFANAREAVEWLAQNMDGEGFRHVAQKILPVVRSAPIHYVSVGDTVPAKVAELLSSGSAAVAYQAGDITDGKDAIYILEGKGDTEEGLLHEALHIATSRRLLDATAAAEFSDITKAIRSSLYDAGAKSTDQKFKQAIEFFRREFRSPGELVAYGFSSPAFQDLLKLMAADGKFYTDYRTPEQLAKVNKNASFQSQKRIPTPAYSMWHRFVDAVRALFGGPKAYQEVYERAIAANAAIDRNNELASRVEFKTLEEELNRLLDALLQRPEFGLSNGGAAQPIRSSGLESRSRSTGFASTESTRAIQSVVDKFLKQFAGAADLDIRVVRTVADIPERFRPSPFAEGTFNDDAGLIYLVAMNIYGGDARAFQILLHECIGHFGLAQMMGDRFKGILKEVMRAARAKGEVGEDIYEPGHPDYATIEAVRLRYPEASNEEVAQEVLARMAETDPGRTLFGYVRAVVRQWLRDMARAAGIALDVTTAELNDLVAQASRYMRRGDGVAQGVDVDALGVADMAVGGMASRGTVSPAPTFRVVDLFGNGSRVQHFDDKRGLFYEAQKYPSGRTGWRAGEVIDGRDYWLSDKEFGSMEEAQGAVRGLRISNTAKQKKADKYGAIPALWAGEARRVAKAIIDAGIGVERFSASTQSASKYVYLSSGLKVRIADHSLPGAYDQPDVDYRYGGDIKALVEEIRQTEEGAPTPDSGELGSRALSNQDAGAVSLRADESGQLKEPAQSGSGAGSDTMLSEKVGAGKTASGGMESRAAPTVGQPQQPRTGFLDTILRKAGGELAAKITGPAYDKLTAYLGGKVPEGIKAGMVSDYGLDESYVDRRTGMQTEQQKAARQTKTFVEGLMDLDRAQSRVAYQWLNNRGAEADRLMAQLPQESQQVLKDIKIQIAKLTIEAVRLGQLDAETASRNFLAYLHRSYAKYDLNTDDKTWKAERAKAIKILGDQYKGRGLKMDVDPDRIHSAPGWWQDEMKGKRVQVLKNDAGRFAFVAEGTAIPPNLSGYKVEGVWEIRARKAADRITLWRDFTQDERQMMGELDEAKYAVARTLFMMNRDIEVGRFHEWVADEYAKTPEEAEEEGLQMADASDSMMRAFTPGEWVTVPTSKIPGTGVFKYGALAGMVVPGPVWNDIRQISAGRFEPFGAAYASILRAWKLSKTALTPTTHVNNIMGNFVMADMHDVGARDAIAAVRLMVAAANGDKDAKAMLDRFEDSGATQGMFTTHELKKEVLEPLLQQLREEVGMADDEAAILKASAIMSLALHGQFGEAWAGAKAAAKQSMAGRVTGAVVTKAQDYYQAEDSVFRLAAFLKSVDEGKTDLEAGKLARKAFLDYHINAPWINAMRGTAMPFIAFAYRAIPMLTETAAKKPWKIAKYMLVAGGLNALAYALLGADADEDKERAYLPEEKAGRLWGIVPKLIRMPWNRESKLRDGKTTSDPVFLDVRRWIPVGDVVDYGQDKTALPMIPQPLIPGGPMIMVAEFLVNKSAFTGKELTKETDTWVEKAAKVGSHFYKGFAPNVPIPYSGTWAGTKIDNAIKGKEDPLGRAYPVPEAIASGFGLKLERYPVDTLQRNAVLDMKGKLRELSDAQRQAARDYGRQGMTKRELDEKVTEIVGKKNEAVEEYKAKERKAMGR